MKKRNIKIIHIMNWCLLFSLPVMLLTVKVDTSTETSLFDTKKLSTNLFSKVEEVAAVRVDPIEDAVDSKQKKDIFKRQEEVQTSAKKKLSDNKEVLEKDTNVDSNSKEENIPVFSDVLASYTGTMSFYNANCTGCSGITSTGVDVSDGRLYYQDKEYGQVRIVAAGTEIKKWSIIRIKNSSMGSNVLAIVLDRGGDIGLGRKFLIDMLTNSSEGMGGVNRNITVEVLRNGR